MGEIHAVERGENSITWSCGCRTSRGPLGFVMEPCSLDCELFQYADAFMHSRGVSRTMLDTGEQDQDGG